MNKSSDNNRKHYCVLWIPTTQHKRILPLLENDIEDLKKTLKEINEKTDHLPIYDKENGNIYLKNVTLSDIEIEEKSPIEEKALIDEMPYYLVSLLEPEDIASLKEQPHLEETLYLDLILKENTTNPYLRDIEIICKEKDLDSDSFKPIWTLTLKCEDASRNGLIKYSYTADSESGKLLDSDDNLIHVVYHAIKGFYHIHEFHKEGGDSILNPFKTDKPKEANIKADNNPALKHYLELFGEMFDGYVKNIRSESIEGDIIYSMDDVGEEQEASKKVDFFNRKDRAYKIYMKLLRKCTNALGISVYANSLLSSKYNKSFNERNLISSYKEGTDGYTNCQKAINLYNSIEYIRLLKVRSRNRVNIASTLKNAVRQKDIESTLDCVKALQDQNAVQQESMSNTLGNLKTLQDQNVRQQVAINTTLENLKTLQDQNDEQLSFIQYELQRNEETSKKLSDRSNFFAIVGLVLAVVGLVLAVLGYSGNPLKSDDIKNIVIESIELRQNNTDDLIKTQAQGIIDSIELIPQKTKNISIPMAITTPITE